MQFLNDPVLLSRCQFALTAMFHILWPVLTIGLSLFLVTVEALWLKTGNVDYYHHARFWSKLLLLNFTVGVVSGLGLEPGAEGPAFFRHLYGGAGCIAVDVLDHGRE